MIKRRSVGQLIITIAFFYSALLCYFEVMERHENNEFKLVVIFGIACFLSLAGAFRYQIADLIYLIRKLL
tara:strand:+ start:71 stop:280 length:210 start_codon:yes stop_codon:yes gene_type:complete